MTKFAAVLTAAVLCLGVYGCSASRTDAAAVEGEGAILSNVSGGGEPQEEVTELQDADIPLEENAYEPSQDLGNVSFDGKEYAAKENVTNILLLGIDSDADRVKQSMGWRSDMVMLVSIDSDGNHITCTSIPRDTRATVAYLDDNGQVIREAEEKLNHAYGYGGGPSKYSAENAMRATAHLLECGGLINVPIHYYISIDLDGLPKLADALDGVPVTLDESVPDVGKKGETVTLSGKKVRLYLENRHDMDDGEFSRQRHEQEFIRSMATKIKEMGAAQAAPDLYDTFIKFMRTNMSLDDVLSVATVLDNTSISDMTFNMMEEGNPEVIDGTWYYRASQDEILRQMLQALYNQV